MRWICDARTSAGVANDCARTCASSQAAHPLDDGVYVCCATTKDPL